MRTLILFFLVVNAFCSSTVFAQNSHSDYLAVIDTLPLSGLRQALRASESHGFDFRAYWSDEMEWYFQQGTMNVGLKSLANEKYLQLLMDMSLGIVDPALVGSDIRINRKNFISAKQLQVLLLSNGQSAESLLESLAPQSDLYLDLKNALTKLSSVCNLQAWNSLLPSSRTLREGMTHKSVRGLKIRLAQLGYQVRQQDDVFDKDTVDAVSDIQSLLRLQPDGAVSPGGNTWKYLTTPCWDRMRQIRADMEKLRWFQTKWEDRYIFINLATNEFKLYDRTVSAAPLLNFRTISGRAARPTPTIKDRVFAVVINPYWVVPPTIFKEDKIGEFRHLSPTQIGDYFYDNHYEIWDTSFTRQINPASIDWKNLDPQADAKFYIRQQPYGGNVLGSLKFILTNSLAIYLHDTNQKSLFNSPQRLLSSGCVRLEQPLELAEYLLKETEWTRKAIEEEMAKPGEVMAGETKITPPGIMPVYMIYLTSQMGVDGVIRFTDDPYEQNMRVLRAGAW